MNSIELYLLGRRLMTIAVEAMPADSPMRRISPGPRLVLEDLARHPGGATGDEIAGRTGLLPDQVSVLVSQLSGDGFLEQSGDRITVGRRLPFRQDAPPVDEALAAALGTGGAEDVREVTGILEKLAGRLGTGTIPRSTTDFDAAYGGTPPWDTGRPQPAFTALAESGKIRGRVLDVGCGTGEHALLAASLGLDATGVDTSPTAIGFAKRKAAERNLPARFIVHDALDLGTLGEQFDTVLDSALFHVFSDEERLRYAASLRQVISSGGRYFMICFSDRQPPGFGPRRVSRKEIEDTFADGWRIDEIEPVTLEATIDPAGVRAWRAALTRV